MILHLQQRQDQIRARREYRQQARNARLRRQFLRYFLLVALLVLAGAAFKYIPWNLTDIDKDIIVQGNQVVSSNQIKETLAGCLGQPLYKLDPALLERKVKALADVRYAFIRRYVFPHPHLQVTVLEEFPWASFANQPGETPTAVISETGRLIPLWQFPSIIQPELTIYGPSDFSMSSTKVAQWADWASYISSQTSQKVDYIDMRSPSDIRILNGDLYLKIGSADSTLTKRLGRLASVMTAIAKYQGRLQYIDLSLDNNIPFRLTDKNASANNLARARQL